jgi:hypothetical protein
MRKFKNPTKGRVFHCIASLSLLLPATSGAAVSPACQQVFDSIDTELRRVAITAYIDMFDDSAPRETMRQMKINNSLLIILALQNAAREMACPVKSVSISQSEYMSDALRCTTDRASGKTDSPACDFRTWARHKTYE